MNNSNGSIGGDDSQERFFYHIFLEQFDSYWDIII